MEDDEPRKTKKTKKDADIAKDVIEVLSDEEDEGEEKGVIIDEGDGSEKEPPKKRVKRGTEEKEPKGEASEKSEDSDGADEKSDVGKEDGEAEEREEDEEDEEDEDKEIDAKDIKKMKKEMAIPTKGPNKNIAPPSDIYASDLMCPDCQIPNQDFEEDYANGDVICRECGLVVGKVVDMGEEKRNFAESGVNRSRTSMTDPLLNDGGLRTQISDDGGGKAGVAQWHSRVQNSVEDAKLLNGYSQIEQIAELLKVNESTKVISKQLFHRFESKRRKSMRLQIEPLVAAIIYIASKKTLPFKHISRETSIPIKKITESYRKLKEILPNQDSAELVSPADLVPRVCSEMRLSVKLVNLAQEIAQEGTAFLEGKNPSSIAAASVYLAATIMGEPASPHSTAEAASISAATVHHVFKELQSHQSELKCLQNT